MYTRIFLFLLLLTFYSCRSISRIRYEAAQSAGTVESYQQFIRDNPKSRFLEDAEDKLYKTAYVKAVEENTAKAYDDYIRKYPESSYLEDLIEKKEDTLIAEVFKEAQEENTLQGYIDFVTKYPEHDLAKEATKSILNKQKQLQSKPTKPTKSSESSLADITKLTPDQISNLSPEQIDAIIKRIQQQQPPKTASNITPVAQPPSAQIKELVAQAPLAFPLPTGFVEEPTAVDPNKRQALSRKADLQEGQPQTQAKARIVEGQPQIQAEAGIVEGQPQIQAKAGIVEGQPQIQAEGQTSAEQYGDFLDDTPIGLRSPGTPNKILYGKAFVSPRAPRVIHKEFSFFIRALQRTAQYVEIKASFHNLNKLEKEFFFSRINLVNSQGKRVKPISVRGGGWQVA